MIFKPVDEMSLRQLFSTEYAKSILQMSYIGPVLDQQGKIDPSPDALILDMRKSPYRVKRCEFKFVPSGAKDFSHNGKFEMAIVWSIQAPITKGQLLNDLLAQNGCSEIVVLDEISNFHKLPEYNLKNLDRNFNGESIRDMLLKVKIGLPALTVIYIASKIYPNRFNSDKMIELLVSKYPSVAAMQAKGRGNVVGTFIQTNPSLLEKMHHLSYKWKNDFDNVITNAVITEVIVRNFEGTLPSEDEIKNVIYTDRY